MSTSEKKPRRPFHETIVDQIRGVRRDGHFFSDDLFPIGRLLMATKIPKNHDAIIAAWLERCDQFADEEDLFFAEVLADLRQQKEEAEAEARLMAAARGEPLPAPDTHSAIYPIYPKK